ncbi:MAG TPA: PASTA domain-containing protein [Bacteroidales bacterium]|nr:PASTA domain-containing protein [Bacteroidales bacterium]HOX77370.1 PASTA domain-containing protein [Bacteroidales bacterium]HPI85693.1 PASTA domain-containing protein [Bacteroidales bacterium]HPM91548.1 PASTA domain-containing protein [Bacteroidales bacterium]
MAINLRKSILTVLTDHSILYKNTIFATLNAITGWIYVIIRQAALTPAWRNQLTMGALSFLVKKNFYIHFGISVILTIALLLIVISLLKVYTRHGEAYIVPDLTGKEYDRLFEIEETNVFQFIVTDSVFDNSLLPGSVIKQNPSPGSKAKEGRTIYLTIVSYTPKMSRMPELKDLTVRQAVTTLRTGGLKIRKLVFTPHFAGNSVLGQYFEGDTLLAGTEILEGSEIDLLAGLGENRSIRVPIVMGLTRDEARSALQMASLNAGKEHYLDRKDPMHSRVYRQFPSWQEDLYPGDSVTLYFRSDLTYNFDDLLNSVNPDTAVFLDLEVEMPTDSLEPEID